MKTLCIGEILWDIFSDHKVWGGAPANFIFHTAQLGADATAYSAVGKDQLGTELSTAIKSCGINLLAEANEYPTGKVDILIDDEGHAQYQFNNNCSWDYIAFTPELQGLSSEVDLIVFGSLAQRHEQSRATIYRALAHKKPSAKILFDINLRQDFYNTEIIEASLKACDFLKLNEDELPIIEQLFGITLDAIIERYDIELVIFTLGAEGSRIISKDGVSDQPAVKCKVVDTVGAGDSFTASFIINYLSGTPIPLAQSLASEIAAFVCTQKGATVELPIILKQKMENVS